MSEQFDESTRLLREKEAKEDLLGLTVWCQGYADCRQRRNPDIYNGDFDKICGCCQEKRHNIIAYTARSEADEAAKK